MRPIAGLLALALLTATAAPLAAQSSVTEGEGWRVMTTEKSYDELLADLKEAVTANKMGIVTEAGPTEMAKERGETIPGNRVVGVFRNDLAVNIIRAAPGAMIEAPVRFMVMEEEDGTATLAYIEPSTVFAPYEAEGGEALASAVETLDTTFATIAEAAVAP